MLQLRRKGVITLPVELRRRYGLNEGDIFTLVDLGDGTFLLSPQVSQMARQGDRVSQIMGEEGVSLEEMLELLDQEREDYYRDQYVET
jgi:bifunctional DNA-binding transcriptional regulator/antitoxin component of YhaV-PrlF toxin-antitoxin module